MKRYKVWNVKFVTDGAKLSKEGRNWMKVISVPTDETDIEYYLSEKISDMTGFLHDGFNYKEIKLKND